MRDHARRQSLETGQTRSNLPHWAAARFWLGERVGAVAVVYTEVYIQALFDWDESKNRINPARHGIDFALARLASDDPFAVTMQDRDVDGEQRYQLIGAVFTRIILVAHAIRADSQPGLIDEEPIIRIISARKATPGERKLYEQNATH